MVLLVVRDEMGRDRVVVSLEQWRGGRLGCEWSCDGHDLALWKRVVVGVPCRQVVCGSLIEGACETGAAAWAARAGLVAIACVGDQGRVGVPVGRIRGVVVGGGGLECGRRMGYAPLGGVVKRHL